MMAEAGTLCRCAMASTVSPCVTVTAVPPSQVHCSGGLRGACTEPVTSEPEEEPGGYEAMPRPPPAIPVEVAATGCGCADEAATVAGRAAPGGGSWFDSTRPAGAGATEPVTSPGPPLEPNGFSLKRVVSLEHPAALAAISIRAIACGRPHGRSNSTRQDMVYPLARNNNSAS